MSDRQRTGDLLTDAAIAAKADTSAAQHQEIKELEAKLRKTREDASRIREAIDNLEIPKDGLPKDRLGVWVLALNMVIEVIDKETTNEMDLAADH